MQSECAFLNTAIALKNRGESFSKTTIRITDRKPLSEFYGVLGRESGKKLENAIREARQKRNSVLK